MSTTSRRNRMFAVHVDTGPLINRAMTYREAEDVARRHVRQQREGTIIRKRNVPLSRIFLERDGTLRIDMTVEGSAYA